MRASFPWIAGQPGSGTTVPLGHRPSAPASSPLPALCIPSLTPVTPTTPTQPLPASPCTPVLLSHTGCWGALFLGPDWASAGVVGFYSRLIEQVIGGPSALEGGPEAALEGACWARVTLGCRPEQRLGPGSAGRTASQLLSARPRKEGLLSHLWMWTPRLG